ncbi:MAG: hypothetical protein AABW49_01145 [Nanoarchaeota archaeon]
MLRRKRGEITPGTDVAALVLLIGLFILLYVLLLPPSDRAALLGEDGTTVDKDGESNDKGLTLLSAVPGDLSSFDKSEIVKELATATLFTKSESVVTNLATGISVSKTPFSSSNRLFPFQAENLNDIESAKLFFFIEEGDGTFYVKLNGVVIFEQELSPADIPIELPVQALTANNNLELGVRGRWWEDYTLRDINIKLQTAYENTRARRAFFLTNTERKGVEDAELSYFLDCLTLSKNGLMTVLLNEKILSSDFVVCDAGKQTIDLPFRLFKDGENIIEFRIDKGNYQIEDLKLKIKLGEAEFPRYNFEVDDDTYFEIFTECYDACIDDCEDDCGSNEDCDELCVNDCRDECDRKEVVIKLKFDGEERARGAITINEFQINFNTVDSKYERTITESIRRGDNVIKIIPKSEFEIIDLRVVVDG